jgi:hypothetical protein
MLDKRFRLDTTADSPNCRRLAEPVRFHSEPDPWFRGGFTLFFFCFSIIGSFLSQFGWILPVAEPFGGYARSFEQTLYA